MSAWNCVCRIIGDEQRTYLVVKGTDRNRALRLSRANGWHGDSEILMLCNSRISVLIRIKEELHSTRLYYVQACRVLGSNLPILFGFQDHLRIKKQYSMSYYQRVLLLFFTLIIINKIAPPPPIRDFNNNTYDCNEESGRSAANYK